MEERQPEWKLPRIRRLLRIGNSAAQGNGRLTTMQRMHAGFRSDWDLSEGRFAHGQAIFFANRENQTNRSALWRHPTQYDLISTSRGRRRRRLSLPFGTTASRRSGTSLQAYYDSSRRTDYGIPVKATRLTSISSIITASEAGRTSSGALLSSRLPRS